MPTREATFRQVLMRILPQLDRLYVYFDKVDEIPSYIAEFPKVVPLLGREHGEVQGDGKFIGLKLLKEPSLYFCFDDDIAYPPGYVEIMASALERHDFKVIVGIHGSRFKPPFVDYMKDRSLLHFTSGMKHDSPVDIVGTGTMAFHSSTYSVDPTKWHSHKMADILIAVDAASKSVPRIVVRRAAGLLRPLEENQPDSLYRQLLADHSDESRIMRETIAAHPEWWLLPSQEKSTATPL